ncbi:MAG: hypothetical protein OEW25_00970 [Nitrospira sp.]|nr:hypothetical protein [Nitrospira sp.]MDH5251869.1 hypothetical protein [Nitrospira sp.]
MMSLPDYLLDEPEMCPEHGVELPCRYCQNDNIDLYADMAIQDKKEKRE